MFVAQRRNGNKRISTRCGDGFLVANKRTLRDKTVNRVYRHLRELFGRRPLHSFDAKRKIALAEDDDRIEPGRPGLWSVDLLLRSARSMKVRVRRYRNATPELGIFPGGASDGAEELVRGDETELPMSSQHHDCKAPRGGPDCTAAEPLQIRDATDRVRGEEPVSGREARHGRRVEVTGAGGWKGKGQPLSDRRGRLLDPELEREGVDRSTSYVTTRCVKA